MKSIHNIVKKGVPKMNTYRKTVIIVGMLFIIATVANVVGFLLFSKPILDAPDYLVNASANANRLITGALLELIAAFACAGIAIGLYPALRKHNEGLALGAVGFRLIEGILYVVAVIMLLSILTLSREYVKAGTPDASFFQASGSSLLAVRDWAGQLGVIAFTLGGLMYYAVFYQSKLIPRWLSGWGFVGVALLLASALLSVCGQIVPFSPASVLLSLPIGVQEMVLAVWLIVKGFNSSEAVSLSAKTELAEG
jgi:Domain of unknown function (DUF4386)